MLLIKNYLASSAIHGVGVFAAESLQEGQILWRIHPTVDIEFPRAEFDKFPEVIKRWIATYAFITSTGGVFFCGDNARFMNHSFMANVVDVEDYCVASRIIINGDELTYDYRSTPILQPNAPFLHQPVSA